MLRVTPADQRLLGAYRRVLAREGRPERFLEFMAKERLER
jgi:hypothetical protein